MKQAIVNNEAIVVIDAYVKDGNMTGLWKIKDLHKCE